MLNDTAEEVETPNVSSLAQTLQVMCPELMSRVKWNNETKGDICESMMGMYYEWRHCLRERRVGIRPVFGRQLALIAGLVNAFVYKVYRLHVRVGDLRLHEFLV